MTEQLRGSWCPACELHARGSVYLALLCAVRAETRHTTVGKRPRQGQKAPIELYIRLTLAEFSTAFKNIMSTAILQRDNVPSAHYRKWRHRSKDHTNVSCHSYAMAAADQDMKNKTTILRWECSLAVALASSPSRHNCMAEVS